MKNIDIVNDKLKLVLVGVLFFIFWMLGFMTEHTLLVENIALLVVGIMVLLCLVFSKNINNILIFILLVPFIFARPLDPMTIPVSIYVACGCLVVGLIVHYLKTKPKFKYGALLYGLCFLGVGMILGGINIPTSFWFYQIGIMIFVVTMFIVVYLYFIASSKKINFENIAFIITILGAFISLQSVVFFLNREHILESLTIKVLNVGWGVTNNIALMLLVTIPFTFYLFIKSKKIDSLIYFCLFALQSVILLFTHSRGGLVAYLIELILMFVLHLVIYKKDKTIKIKVITAYSIGLVGAISIFVILYFYNKEYFNNLIKSLESFNFKSLNGRIKVYTDALVDMKKYLFFGKGVLFSMFTVEDEIGTYVWGHSTILQTFTTMGIFGTLGLFYHFFEKYYVLLKKCNPEKIIIFLSLFCSGLYGLVDVSYYFINYMIVLVLIFIVCEPYFYNWKLEKNV